MPSQGDAVVRSRRGIGASLSALLGVELREPIVELQGGWLAGVLGPIAYATTAERRRERREASQQRLSIRRELASGSDHR